MARNRLSQARNPTVYKAVPLRSESKVAQTRMVVGVTAQGPSEVTLVFSYREVIDAGDPTVHQAIFVKFPIFIAVGAEPIAAIVVVLVGEANPRYDSRQTPRVP